MLIVNVAFEFSRTNFHKSNAAAMIRIHVGVNFKNKTGKTVLLRLYNPFAGLYRTRTRGNPGKTVQQFFHAEIIRGAAEKNGSNFARKIFFHVKFGINAFNKFKVFAQFNGIALAAEMSDAVKDKNGNFSMQKAAKFAFDNILVEPKGTTMDSFDDMDTMVEVVTFCMSVANGQFRNKKDGGTTAEKS